MAITKSWVIHEDTFPKKESIEKQLKFLIKYAILAPSAYNTQPWIFEIKKNKIIIHPDYSRKLPATDKSKRELWISLGCALKNILLAGEHFGLIGKEKVTEKEITISFKEGRKIQNKLFDFITQRATNRRKARKILVKKEELAKLKRLPFESHTNAMLIDDKNSIDEIFNLIEEANNVQYQNEHFKKELIESMRFNKKSLNKTNDGVSYNSLDIPPLPTIIGKKILNFFLNKKTINKSDKDKLKTSSGLIVITSPTDCNVCWVNTGKTLESILLLLTSINISYSFLNSVCEVTKTRKKLGKLLKATPQIILRIGHAKDIAHSKRRPIEEVLKE